MSDRDRLLRIGIERTETTYGSLLAAMTAQGGELGVLAAYHASELGLRDAATRLEPTKNAFGDLAMSAASVVAGA